MSARRVFLIVYALSGVSALIYEVCWTRLLTLHMGHTSASVSTVLAAFMGGLAAGAALGGRFASRVERVGALRVYAALEIAIAGFGLVLPFVLGTFDPFLARAYANGDGGLTFAITRLVSSLLVIVLPCALMGATFPMAARWFVRDVTTAGGDAGAMYAANTVGATAGAIVAGFWLIPLLGLRGTTWTAIGLNAIAAVGAVALTRSAQGGPDKVRPTTEGATTVDVVGRTLSGPPARRKKRPEARHLVTPHPRAAAIAIAVSGCVALVCEVTWTRVFALIIGPTTYAFSTMLAAFIGGIALGSAAGSAVAARTRRPLAWLAMCLAVAAIGSVTASSFVDDVLIVVGERVASPDVSFGSVLGLQTIVAAALLFPLTLTLGAAFPIAVAAAARRTDALAGDVSDLYAANTVGAIAGSLAAGFVLIPLVGLNMTFRVAGAAAVVVAGALLLGAEIRHRTRLAGPIVIVAGLAAVGLTPTWDIELLTSGVYKYAPYLRGSDLITALKIGDLLYYEEGSSATVTVRDSGGTISLAIDGKVDASNAGDMLTQKLLAHLPLLLHPKPRDVCIIGLGSGVTAGAALRHPVARVDVLEISPEVVEASSYFAQDNDHALQDPRLHLIVGDGRTHLLLASRQYDVIVSEPSNPWMAGVATLFTEEFFRAARARLAPGGILCQWSHTYDISEHDLRSIAATFKHVFPDGTMWLVGSGDLLFLGSDRPLDAALPQIAAGWQRPGVAADLREVDVNDPFAVHTMYLAGSAGLSRFSQASDGPIPLQTDDRLSLEFSAPRSIYGRSNDQTLDSLRALGNDRAPPALAEARAQATAQSWRGVGHMLFRAEASSAAVDAFLQTIALDPRDADSWAGLTRAAAPANRLNDAQQAMERTARDQPDNAVVRIALSRVMSSRGDFEGGIRLVNEARGLVPGDPVAREQLASIYADMSEPERLEPLVVEMTREAPERPDTLYYTAALAFLSGQPAAAVEPASRLVGLNPKHARAQNLLGASYASLGRSDDARKAFQASIRADPKDPAAYANLAVHELQSGNVGAAAEYFAEALAIDPASAAAREGLAEALDRQGYTMRAARVRRPSS